MNDPREEELLTEAPRHEALVTNHIQCKPEPSSAQRVSAFSLNRFALSGQRIEQAFDLFVRMRAQLREGWDPDAGQ